MGYVVEKMGPEDCEQVLRSTNDAQRRRLNMRNEFLEMYVGIDWTIDRERNVYLMPAPRPDPRSMEAHHIGG